MWWKLLLLGTVALVLGLALGRLRAPRAATPAPRPQASASPSPLLFPLPALGDSRARWKARWTRTLPLPLTLSLAPDGGIAVLDSQKQVRALDAKSGATRWSSPPLLFANALAAVRGGAVLVGARFNPSLPKAWLLNAETGKPSAFSLPGTLWCFAATPDGRRAFFGTGASSLLAFSLVNPNTPPELWRMSALPESLALSTDGSSALTGTWLPSGVRRIGYWAYADSDPARWQETQVSADGATAVSLSGRRPRRSARDLQLTGYDMDSGLRLWEKRIPGRAARALVSADGQRIALSYVGKSERGAIARLLLLNRDGTPRGEEKGGRFFAPRLVALSAQGEQVTVLDGDRALFVLDQDGKTRWRLALPDAAPIRETHTTADGSFLLVVRVDGTLTLYEALP